MASTAVDQTGLSDDDVFGVASAPAAPPSGGMSDDEVFGRGFLGWQRDLSKRFVQGAKETLGQQFQGVAEAIPPDEGNAFRAAAGRYIMQGVPYDEAVQRADADVKSGAARPQSPTDTLTYKFGSAISDTGKEALTPALPTGVPGDVAGAAGSVTSNLVGPGLSKLITGGIQTGVKVATALLPFGGAGEAAERARKAGATEPQIAESARYGTLAGATDLADIALLRSGVLGRTARAAASKVIGKMIEGGILEGSQEYVQEVIQNAIEKHGYNPERNYTDNALYNFFIGAIVGGGAKPILDRGDRGAATTPTPQQEQQIRAVTDYYIASGVDPAQAGGMAQTAVMTFAGGQEAATAAAGYGGSVAPTTTPVEPTAPKSPDQAINDVHDVLGMPPPMTAPDVPPVTSPDEYGAVPPGVASAPPSQPPMQPAPGFEIRPEGGMFNVYIDGQIENNFGAESDAINFVNRHPLAKARIAATIPSARGPKLPGEGSLDPRVVDFIETNMPGLTLPPDSKFRPSGQMTEDDVFAPQAQEADSFAQGKQVISDFVTRNIDKGRGNEWIDVPEGRMYLRIARRPRVGTVVDVSNLNFNQKGTGAFTNYLTHIEDLVLASPKLEGVYVENVLNDKLVPFLERRGYVREGGAFGPPSFVMPKGRLSILQRNTATRQDLGDVKTNPGFSMRTASLLGSNLYGGPERLSQVTIKEIVQNSFDAIKGLIDSGKESGGKIEIEVDPKTRTITVADDGSGIPLNVLTGPFFQVGGTQKTTKRASGGHGIAKMAFIFGNEDLRVATMHDGVVYTVQSKGADLFDFLEKGDEAKRPIIKRRTPTREDKRAFSKGHGTLISVKLPATYNDPSTGVEKPIPLSEYDFQHPVLGKSPLFDNIDVTFNGKELPIGRSFPLEDYTPMMNINFAWGTARVYGSKKPEADYQNTHVLSNGLWQFDTQIKKAGGGYASIERDFYIDVQPKVSSGEPGYPFSLDRQQFSPRVTDDFQQIFRYIGLLDALETFKSNVANYGDMQYLNVDGGKVVVGPKTRLELTAPPPETPFGNLGAGGQISVKDGKLVVGGKTIPEITPEMMDSFKIDASALKIPQDQIDVSKVILHDNTEITISDLEKRTISDMGREKFGEAFDEYVVQVGNLFIEMRDQASRLLSKQFGDAVYGGMKNDAIGISFDPEYRGVSIRIPFQGEFINLAAPEVNTEPVITSLALAGTMIHELAHYVDRTEDRRELQRVLYVLEAAPDWNYRQWQQRLVDVVARNWDIQTYINGVMTNGVFDVRSRGSSLATSTGQRTTRGLATDLGAPGTATGAEPGVPGRVATSTIGDSAVGQPPTSYGKATPPRTVTGLDDNATASQRADQSAINADGDPGVPAVRRQPEIQRVLDNLKPVFAGVGGVPPSVRTAAAHASRINWFTRYWHGLDQMVRANPQFIPLLRYAELIRQMHNEESKIHDIAVHIEKDWRRLGPEADRLTAFLDDMANMRYRTPQEVAQGVKRHPTQAETTALVAKHKLSNEGMKVGERIRAAFDLFLGNLERNAIEAANRILQNNPQALIAKINEIQAWTKELRSKPYFPFLRFGVHYVMVKDAAGRVIHFETFERRGVKSAAAVQQAAYKAELARRPKTEKVTFGKLAESSRQFVGMPPTLLNQIKLPRAQGGLGLTQQQIEDLELIQLSYAPALAFRQRMLKSDYTPGYSHDFRRAFARYFFHGGRYYARTKYGYELRNHIDQARKVENSNKASAIADYMEDHLDKTILDAKGDFGALKGLIFFQAMGYSVAAATMNMTQTPLVTFPYLATKFGGPGVGDVRAAKAIIAASANVKNFYKKGYYNNATQFEYEALGYGIRTGRVSETQAAALAGLAGSQNLIQGIAGNAVQRGMTWLMENSSWFFETSEQFNRRVAFRAALDLAMKYPNATAVKEAINTHQMEYQELQAGSPHQRPFSAAEAAAIVTAANVVDTTQFVYARYARPRFMRGPLSSTIFVFKKYMHDMLTLLGQQNNAFLVRFLFMSLLLGGTAGTPGYDDLRDIANWLARWWFGKDFNLDRETRNFVIALTDGTIPPDLILHGLSRYGWGFPAVADMMGSAPSRGFRMTQPGPTPGSRVDRPAQNVPFPVLDRSRAVSMGHILPVEIGKLFDPARDLDKTIAEQTQQASGAIFSVGFNAIKAVMGEGERSDFKRWERMMPRALSSASRSYRAYSEGRERSRGGPDSAATVLPFDPRDNEQMAEVIAMGLGYQPLRLQARWDLILAQAEAKKYVEANQKILLNQWFEAQYGKDPKEIEDVRRATVEYNMGLPDWAKGYAISGDTIRRSVTTKANEKAHREIGIPSQRRDVPLAREMQRLHPESTVDVRRVQ